jgi:adenylate cyclase
MSLIAELKRRKVFKVGGAYLVVGWLLIQVAATVAPQLNLPEWVPRLVTFIILLGFPITMVLAWVFDVTPEGVKLDTNANGSKRIFAVAAVLAVLAVGWYFRGQPAFRKGEVVPKLVVASVASVDPHSIAVLPFLDMSQAKDQEYFSDGLSEQLLNQLAQIPQLRVIARTSSFSFKGKEVDIATIAKTLNVANVLEGSVRKSGNTVRITAQLIRTADSTHLWSQTYDRELTDIFKVQDEIADAIANALELKITGHEVATSNAGSANPAAYDAYLQGRAYVAKRYLENLDQAIAAFDRAIALEPGYSAAYSGRAFAQLLRPLWGAPDFDASFTRARDSANKALQFDPDNAEAYMVRGMAAYFDRNATSAGVDLGRALTLAPGNVDVLNMKGDFHTFLGDLGEGERLKRQAMALDPLAFVHPMNLSDVLSEQGRYPEAIVAAQQAVSLGAKDYGFDRLVFAQVRSGHFKEARAAMEQGCAITGPTGNNCETNQILLLAATGQRAQAEAMLDALVRDIRSGKHAVGFYTPAALSSLYCEVSNFAKAAVLQRQALDTTDYLHLSSLISAPGGARLPEEISTNPDWLAVWNDPRLKDLMSVYRRNVLAWRASRH